MPCKAESERIPTPLTSGELQARFAELGLRDRTLVLLDVQTGMRRGELLAIQWRYIDFPRHGQGWEGYDTTHETNSTSPATLSGKLRHSPDRASAEFFRRGAHSGLGVQPLSSEAGLTMPSSALSWCDVKNRYLGFRFKILGKIHYGWRLSTNKGGGFTATLIGYAYETIPGKAIIAGKTKGPDDDDQPAPASLKAPPVRPVTLGTLALGAPGLSIWRREESVVAEPESN